MHHYFLSHYVVHVHQHGGVVSSPRVYIRASSGNDPDSNSAHLQSTKRDQKQRMHRISRQAHRTRPATSHRPAQSAISVLILMTERDGETLSHLACAGRLQPAGLLSAAPTILLYFTDEIARPRF